MSGRLTSLATSQICWYVLDDWDGSGWLWCDSLRRNRLWLRDLLLGSWLWLNRLWLNRLWLNGLWVDRLWVDRLWLDRFLWRNWDNWSGCRLGADTVILSWGELSEKLTVPLGHSPGSIDTDHTR